MSAVAPYFVGSLDDVKLGPITIRRLRHVRQQGQTGVLLRATIRTGPRSASKLRPIVWIDEGDRTLCEASPATRRLKWAALTPGRHRLKFFAARPKSASSFEREIELNAGDVLLVVCEPIQTRTFYAASPSVDRWYIGVV